MYGGSFDSGEIKLFSTWVPLEVLDLDKARGQTKEGDRGPIRGVVGSEARDQDGEVVYQKGLDWDYFLSKGYFNWEHQPGPENSLGEPERVFPTTDRDGFPATGVEGFLWLSKARAREIYDTAIAMRKARSSRTLGFSVEGHTLARDSGGDVIKAQVLDVAITRRPINPNAVLEALAKSLTVGYQTPATPASSAHLSPLVPQSMGAGLPSSTYTHNITLARFAKLIREMSPEFMSKSEAEGHALRLASACRAVVHR